MSNHMANKVWDEITHPFRNWRWNGCNNLSILMLELDNVGDAYICQYIAVSFGSGNNLSACSAPMHCLNTVISSTTLKDIKTLIQGNAFENVCKMSAFYSDQGALQYYAIISNLANSNTSTRLLALECPWTRVSTSSVLVTHCISNSAEGCFYIFPLDPHCHIVQSKTYRKYLLTKNVIV